jgi:hypothetical protein
MKKFAATAVVTVVLSCLLFLPSSFSQVPQLLNYQGRVTVGGTNFTGTGLFKFALVNATGTTNYWSHDGTTTGVPGTALVLSVTNGLYAVLLGEITPITPTVFNNTDVRVRVWFNDGVSGFQQLAPDRRLGAVGYALVAQTANVAATVADGAVTTSKLAPSAVDNTKLANNSLTVTAGSGLTGGGSVALGGSTTLGIPAAGVANSMLANSAVTITAGSGLSGGGAVALGGAVTLNNSGVLALTAGTGLSSSGGQNPTLSLANSGVGTTQLADSAVTGAKIADGTISAAKLNFTPLTAESDPKVGVTGTNTVAKWNGTALVNSTIFDNGNVGIGTNNPATALHVNGIITAANIFRWQVVSGTSQQAEPNCGYIANNAAQVTITLPTTPTTGDTVRVSGLGAGGWKIAQNAGQSVLVGNVAALSPGIAWTPRDSNRLWQGVASSADGSKLVAVVYGGQIYTSTDSGVTWTPRDSNRNWWAVASSADGSKLVAVVDGGQIYTSAPAYGSPTSTTTVGTGGYLTGGQGTALELQYVGSGQWLPLSHEGSIFAY